MTRKIIRADVVEPFRDLFEPYRYKGCYGGRGSGKTNNIALALVILAAQRPMLILCCREVMLSLADSSKEVIENKIAELGLRSHFHSIKDRIVGANGSRIIFKGLFRNTDTIKSLEGADIVWVDEAQSISQQSLVDLKNTIRKRGSELWFSWNPKSPEDPIDKFLRSDEGDDGERLPEGYKGWKIVKKVNYYDNPYFPDVLRVEMERDLRRDPGMYQHVWLGEYLRNSDAQVFNKWRVGTREDFAGWSIGNPAADVDRHAERYYFGADFGFSPTDPTVLVRCFLYEDKRAGIRELYIDKESVHYKLNIDDVPDMWRKDIPNCQRWPIVADSSNPGLINFIRRNGFLKIEGSRKGVGSVEDGIELLKSYDIIVHPDCVQTIAELTNYSWKVDKRTQQILPVLEDNNNHVIDSLRYALEATRVIRGCTATTLGGV